MKRTFVRPERTRPPKLHGVVLGPLALLAVVFGAAPAKAQEAGASGTVEVGQTGFDVRRPVLASACEHGCPWGELGDFLTDAMNPFHYEVIQCRNCNADKGPPLVSTAAYPPPLGIADTFVGTTTRVDAPVDFGITESGLLAWAYGGRYNYMAGGPYATGASGPYPNLRLIAKIEDPTYLLAAVRVDSGITDLRQIADRHMAVTILGGGSPISQPVLDYYGLTQSAVVSWGGSFQNPIIVGQEADPAFDIIVNELASPANNPESAFWTKITQKHDLRFLDIDPNLLDQLASDTTLGLTRVTVKWGFLRGVDHPIDTVARSGHAVFARDDMPEEAAYETAKAIDQHRDALKWYIRPYSYDSNTVWKNFDVPLHPGAQRYYTEMGYLSATTGGAACDGGGGTAVKPGGGCAMVSANRSTSGAGAFAAASALLLAYRRRFRSAT